jgi:hypothetical protein
MQKDLTGRIFGLASELGQPDKKTQRLARLEFVGVSSEGFLVPTQASIRAPGKEHRAGKDAKQGT